MSNSRIILKDLLRVMQTGGYLVHIRRAFDEDTYYEGFINDIPSDFPFMNRIVCAIYPFSNKSGDVNWENCDSLDIAIGDLDFADVPEN